MTIWSTPDGARHFHINDIEGIQDGDLTLFTLGGRQMEVSPEAVAEMEVTRAEANDLRLEQLRRSMDGIVKRIAEVATQPEVAAELAGTIRRKSSRFLSVLPSPLGHRTRGARIEMRPDGQLAVGGVPHVARRSAFSLSFDVLVSTSDESMVAQ